MLPVKLIIERQEGPSNGCILVFHDLLPLGNADGESPSDGGIPTLQRPQDVAFVYILTKWELSRKTKKNFHACCFRRRFCICFLCPQGCRRDDRRCCGSCGGGRASCQPAECAAWTTPAAHTIASIACPPEKRFQWMSTLCPPVKKKQRNPAGNAALSVCVLFQKGRAAPGH